MPGFVLDVQVHPDHRRRGHGTEIMQAAEDERRDLGMVAIALNVFGQNLNAGRPYPVSVSAR